MARLARLVVAGLPHHVTQRGNRRQQAFFHDEDYAAYVELMAEWCGQHGVEVWAYCLNPLSPESPCGGGLRPTTSHPAIRFGDGL